MGYTVSQGGDTRGIRAEVVDAMVKQIAMPSYKFKQACAVVSTSAWKNTFFREDTSVLTGGVGNSQKGIPRNAAFPTAHPQWEEISVRVIKHGIQDNIAWEDIIAGDINVQSRTVIKLTQAITKSVDDDIWDSLTENRTGTGSISSFAVYKEWVGASIADGASAAIIADLMKASRLIAQNNYDVGDLICFISPKQKQGIMANLVSKGAQFPSLATGVAENGRIGSLAGITLVESNSVTASYALVVKPKTCATWKELVPLKSTTIEDPFKSLTIRIVEEGVLELTDPKAVVLLTNVELS